VKTDHGHSRVTLRVGSLCFSDIRLRRDETNSWDRGPMA
jgi:hypothetical protein